MHVDSEFLLDDTPGRPLAFRSESLRNSEYPTFSEVADKSDAGNKSDGGNKSNRGNKSQQHTSANGGLLTADEEMVARTLLAMHLSLEAPPSLIAIKRDPGESTTLSAASTPGDASGSSATSQKSNADTSEQTLFDAWTDRVPPTWVEGIVKLTPEYPLDGVYCTLWKNILIKEYGRDGTDSRYRVSKVAHIEAVLRLLAVSYVQDKNIKDRTLKVIEIDTIADEAVEGGSVMIQRILRKGRNFKVHDTVAFNCVFRELQRSHNKYPKREGAHGTKGLSEMFDMLGLGPNTDARAHKVYLKQFRGDERTDPDKIHPDIAYNKYMYPLAPHLHYRPAKAPRETDGMYYRNYYYSEVRRAKAFKMFLKKHGRYVSDTGDEDEVEFHGRSTKKAKTSSP
jgi:hypothetical protein